MGGVGGVGDSVRGVGAGDGCGASPAAGVDAAGLESGWLEVGGATGWNELVADGFAGGASDAFKVTLTVSFFNGMLLVCFPDADGCWLPVFRLGGITVPVWRASGTLAVCLDGGEEAPGGFTTSGFGPEEEAPYGEVACFMRGIFVVCFEGASPVCFSKGTLVVCFDGASPDCFSKGTLVVCFDGACPACLSKGTLVVCFDGRFEGEGGWFS